MNSRYCTSRNTYFNTLIPNPGLILDLELIWPLVFASEPAQFVPKSNPPTYIMVMAKLMFWKGLPCKNPRSEYFCTSTNTVSEGFAWRNPQRIGLGNGKIGSKSSIKAKLGISISNYEFRSHLTICACLVASLLG